MGTFIIFTPIFTVIIFFCIRLIDAFLGKRNTGITALLLSCLPYLISSQVSIIAFHDGVKVYPPIYLSVQLLSLFAITLNYKVHMIKRAATVGFIFLLFNVIDNSISLFWIVFPDFTLDYLALDFIRLTIIMIVLFLTSFILRRFADNNKNAVDIPVIWVPMLIISGSAVFFGILYLAEVPHIQEIWIVLMWFAALFLALYLKISLSRRIEERIKAALRAQEKEYYFFQCQLIQESVERVKSIRHDMNLHLAALKGYAVGNKEAVDYINRLLEDISESVVYSDTGNIAFDSIINYKLRDVKKDNIKLNIKILIPPILNVDAIDVATILGNILDNALDAVSRVNERMIKLDIELVNGGLFIKMDNSFNGEIKYSEETQVVSLKNGSECGYGLKNIRQSVEKYNGYMKITHTENIFSVGVFLYVND